MALFSFYAVLMECLWLSTYIPDMYNNTTLQNVVRVIGTVLGVVFYAIANHFENKLKEQIKKLEDQINKEDN